MTTLQAMLFGAMLAWTPSIVVLAVLLRDIPPDDDEQSRSRVFAFKHQSSAPGRQP